MINRVTLVGRITKEPELKKTNNDISFLNITLACNRRFKSQDGTDADFIQCTLWKQTAEYISQYAHKGDLIGVEGRIDTSSYEDKNNNKVYVTKVLAEYACIVSHKEVKDTDTYEHLPINDSGRANLNIGDTQITQEELPFY